MGLFDFFRARTRSQARATVAAPTSAKPSVTDWEFLRTPEREADRELSPLGRAWVEARPYKPVHLAERYPRIANRLALCWTDPELTQLVLDDLLVDRRGGRRGFPPEVGRDLLRLRELHESRLTAKDTELKAWSPDQRATYDRRE